MKELVKFIASTLAEEPEEIEIFAADDRVLELRLAPDDVGKIIGRRGKTAKAIRTLLAASGEGWDLDIAGHGEDEEDDDLEDGDDREDAGDDDEDDQG